MEAVFPTTYFGSIAYFKELAKYDSIYLEAHENFLKQTYRNRCEILTGNGLLSLSIPVIRPKGSHTPIREVQLPSKENWRIRHWRSIKSAYQSAPYFDYYGIEIEELLNNDDDHLYSYNLNITKRILSWLDLDIQILETEEFAAQRENDYRDWLIGKSGKFQIQRAPYIQVFPGEDHYHERISILDAILCQGPLARNLILPR